jgi:hypothetical protein
LVSSKADHAVGFDRGGEGEEVAAEEDEDEAGDGGHELLGVVRLELLPRAGEEGEGHLEVREDDGEDL